MKNWSPIKPNISGIGKTSPNGGSRENTFHVADSYPSEPMRAKRNHQGSIVRVHRIEMDAGSYHRFDHFKGRLHVLNTLLDGPGPETTDIVLPHDCDRSILMPAQRPITTIALVEKNGPNCASTWSEDLRHSRTNRSRRIQKIIKSALPDESDARLPLRNFGKHVLKIRQQRSCKSRDKAGSVDVQIRGRGVHDQRIYLLRSASPARPASRSRT